MIEQTDHRTIYGINTLYSIRKSLGNIRTNTKVGGSYRGDQIDLSLWHSPNRQRSSVSTDNNVHEVNMAFWLEEDLVLSPHKNIDIYLNRGSRFHSNDAMDVIIAQKINEIKHGEKETQNAIFREITGILKKADTYSPAGDNNEHVNMDYSLYKSIWPKAEKMRSSGELLDMAAEIRCPVLAIHGDHDPHPAKGVRIPLEQIIRDFRFFLLPKCGHEPWTEKYTKTLQYDYFILSISQETGRSS